MSIRFHASISDHESSDEALARLVDEAQPHMEAADVAFLFFTPHHAEQSEELAEKLMLEFEPQALVGCSCEGVIGVDREIERTPGMALMLGRCRVCRFIRFRSARMIGGRCSRIARR